MSGDITISDDLINNLYTVVAQHDAAAQENMVVGLQYLFAATGYMLADYPGTDEERDELIDQLAAFTKHVASDRARHQNEQQTQQSQQSQEPQMPAGKSVATDDPAVGIWKPE